MKPESAALRRLLACVFFGGILCVSVVFAQDDEEKSDKSDEPDSKAAVDEIVVTGTHLRGLSLGDSTKHIVVYDSDTLVQIGEPTLARALARLPQSFRGASAVNALGSSNDGGGVTAGGSVNYTGAATINLRGIGIESSLVLLNGKRLATSGQQGGYQDISTIPMSTVDRIEIILDGASTTYGAEAVGGVVNIIQKKEFNTMQVGLRYDSPTDGGYDEWTLDVIGGFSWEGGNLMASYNRRENNYFMRNEAEFVGGSGRQWYSTDIDLDTGQFGSEPNVNIRHGLPATVIFADGSALELSPENLTNTNPSAADFVAHSYDPNLIGELVSLSPSRESDAITITVRQDLADSVSAFVTANYSSATVSSILGPSAEFEQDLAAGNPLNPFGEDVTVQGIYPAFGTDVSTGQTKTLQLAVGTDWAINENWGLRWSANYNDNESRTRRDHGRLSGFNNPLGRSTSRGHGDLHGIFNPWGNGLDNNVEAIDPNGDPLGITVNELIMSRAINTSVTDNVGWYVDVMLEGDLFTVPAGSVRFVVGAEIGNISLEQDSSNEHIIGDSSYSLIDADRDQQAFFAEVNIPLFSEDNAIPGLQSFALNLSGRTEEFTNHGGISTNFDDPFDQATHADGEKYKSNTIAYGFVWEPVDRVRVRANYNESFVPPSLITLFRAPSERQLPCRASFESLYGAACLASTRRASEEESLNFPGRLFRGLNSEGEASYAVFQNTPTTLVVGGNPELEPQESEAVTVGVEVTPLDALKLGVNWHRIDYFDKIANISVAVVDVLDYWHIFPEFVIFEGNELVVQRATDANFDSETQTGLDYTLNYSFYTGFGEFRLDATWSTVLDYEQEFQGGIVLPEDDYLGVRIPRRSGRLGGSWSHEGWYAAFDSAYRGKTSSSQPGLVDADGNTFQSTLTTEGLWQTNVQLGYSFSGGILEGVRLQAGVNNVFDQNPESTIRLEGEIVTFPDGSAPISRNASVGNPLGQMYYLSVNKEF